MTVEVDGSPVARIVIADPGSRNALGLGTLDAICHAVEDLSRREDVRVVVLSGAGGTFSSGGHMKEDVPIRGLIRTIERTFAAIRTSNKPIVAKVEGYCLGLAVGLMASCDIAITARDTRFALPEVRMGQAPAMAVLPVLPRITPTDASQLVLTGTPFDGNRARQMGLVSDSVAPHQLEETVERTIEALLEVAPHAVASCKEYLRRIPALDPGGALALATEVTVALTEGAEAREFRAAKAANRAPWWSFAAI